jgi:hypothetical protein
MTHKTVVIHQPDFVPYLGFFHRLLHADLYIVLDHVQFVSKTSRSWTHRDKIKTPNGEIWLTLGIKKSLLGTPINQIELSDTDWAANNLKLIHAMYRNAPFYAEIIPHIEWLYTNLPVKMAEFNMRSITMLMALLDIQIPFVYSSELAPEGSKNILLIDLLKKTGATHYLSGTGARGYMKQELFNAAGIEVIWQNFLHPTYPQQFGAFIPFLSTLDALFNCGSEGAQALVKSITI